MQGISEGGRPVGVTEDLVQLIVDPLLDLFVDSQEAQHEAGASGSGVVTLGITKVPVRNGMF